MYLAMQCAHSPMESPERFQALYDAQTVPDLVEYSFSSVIDEGIGNVTAALRSKSMWARTLMVVSSDNGGPAFSDQHAASNFPLRGGKYGKLYKPDNCIKGSSGAGNNWAKVRSPGARRERGRD